MESGNDLSRGTAIGAQEPFAIKDHAEGGHHFPAGIAGFEHFLRIHFDRFETQPLRTANNLQLFGDLMGVVIKNQSFRAILRKSPARFITCKIFAFLITDAYFHGNDPGNYSIIVRTRCQHN